MFGLTNKDSMKEFMFSNSNNKTIRNMEKYNKNIYQMKNDEITNRFQLWDKLGMEVSKKKEMMLGDELVYQMFGDTFSKVKEINIRHDNKSVQTMLQFNELRLQSLAIRDVKERNSKLGFMKIGDLLKLEVSPIYEMRCQDMKTWNQIVHLANVVVTEQRHIYVVLPHKLDAESGLMIDDYLGVKNIHEKLELKLDIVKEKNFRANPPCVFKGFEPSVRWNYNADINRGVTQGVIDVKTLMKFTGLGTFGPVQNQQSNAVMLSRVIKSTISGVCKFTRLVRGYLLYFAVLHSPIVCIMHQEDDVRKWDIENVDYIVNTERSAIYSPYESKESARIIYMMTQNPSEYCARNTRFSLCNIPREDKVTILTTNKREEIEGVIRSPLSILTTLEEYARKVDCSEYLSLAEQVAINMLANDSGLVLTLPATDRIGDVCIPMKLNLDPNVNVNHISRPETLYKLILGARICMKSTLKDIIASDLRLEQQQCYRFHNGIWSGENSFERMKMYQGYCKATYGRIIYSLCILDPLKKWSRKKAPYMYEDYTECFLGQRPSAVLEGSFLDYGVHCYLEEDNESSDTYISQRTTFLLSLFGAKKKNYIRPGMAVGNPLPKDKHDRLLQRLQKGTVGVFSINIGNGVCMEVSTSLFKDVPHLPEGLTDTIDDGFILSELSESDVSSSNEESSEESGEEVSFFDTPKESKITDVVQEQVQVQTVGMKIEIPGTQILQKVEDEKEKRMMAEKREKLLAEEERKRKEEYVKQEQERIALKQKQLEEKKRIEITVMNKKKEEERLRKQKELEEEEKKAYEEKIKEMRNKISAEIARIFKTKPSHFGELFKVKLDRVEQLASHADNLIKQPTYENCVTFVNYLKTEGYPNINVFEKGLVKLRLESYTTIEEWTKVASEHWEKLTNSVNDEELVKRIRNGDKKDYIHIAYRIRNVKEVDRYWKGLSLGVKHILTKFDSDKRALFKFIAKNSLGERKLETMVNLLGCGVKNMACEKCRAIGKLECIPAGMNLGIAGLKGDDSYYPALQGLLGNLYNMPFFSFMLEYSIYVEVDKDTYMAIMNCDDFKDLCKYLTISDKGTRLDCFIELGNKIKMRGELEDEIKYKMTKSDNVFRNMVFDIYNEAGTYFNDILAYYGDISDAIFD